ncbi:MAG: TonB-dependent receptor [Bacteroidetes bacterium]|nr:TonB-dependent receptor [Bacteroidota bacterium]
MKSNQYLFILIILFTGFSNLALGQQNETQIKGYIFSPENTPAMYSTVILLNQDSVFMKGAFSQDDGSFVFDNIEQGTYFVLVRNIEFQTYMSQAVTIKKNEKILLDRINLKTSINQLNEVVVTARKAVLEVHADKMVYNVSSSINASGNSGLEMLGKAPGVIVDMDNNIILQGKSGVQVFINGRPSRLSGNDLSNFLESMRSDNIDYVEIITNPSAKYDAEGTGGIINIVLKKNVNLGFNGNLTGNFSQGIYAKGSVGTTLNYSAEKINLYTNINTSLDNWQDDFRETALQSGFLLNKKSDGLNTRKGFSFSGGLDYALSSKQSLSIDGRVFINKRDNKLFSTTGIFDASDIGFGEILRAEVLDKMPTENYNLNVNYRIIPNKTSNFSVDLSLGKYSGNKNTFQPNDYLEASSGTILRSFNSEYDAMTAIDLRSALFDFEKKLKSFTLSAGAKYSYISTNNQLEFYNIQNDLPVFDINKSNDFTYLEKIAALYFIVNSKPTDKITINAGLRMENTSSLGRLESEVPTEDNEVARNYTNFFPNISISFDDKKNSVISASFGKRITRPNYQDLNPFESRMSELSSWKGNPFLKPNYITNYQLTYSLKRKLIIANNYSITRDFFATIFEISEEKGSILIPRNMDKSTTNGLSVSYPLQILKWWELSSFFIFNYSTYKGDLEGTKIDLKSTQSSLRMQNNMRLPGGVAMEVTFNIWGPWVWRGSVNVEGSYGLNFGIKKDFFDRRLLVQLTGNDILNSSSDFYYKSNYGGMIVDGVRSFDNRRVGVNVTYNFGNQKAKIKKRAKSAIDDELKRISD